MTADEFLAWDRTQTMKHEFARGEVFAMAGAHEAHVTAMGNIDNALRQHLRGSPCRTFLTGMKPRVEAADAAAYGWADWTPAMPDDQILRRLLALNRERAALPSA